MVAIIPGLLAKVISNVVSMQAVALKIQGPSLLRFPCEYLDPPFLTCLPTRVHRCVALLTRTLLVQRARCPGHCWARDWHREWGPWELLQNQRQSPALVLSSWVSFFPFWLSGKREKERGNTQWVTFSSSGDDCTREEDWARTQGGGFYSLLILVTFVCLEVLFASTSTILDPFKMLY